MDKLSNEIQDFICQSLPRPDLKSLRLTCRNTHPSSTTALFKRIDIYSFQESFEWIATNKTIRQYVRAVRYIATKLPNVLLTWEWLEPAGESHPPAHRTDFVSQLTNMRENRSYRQFRKYYESQSTVHSGMNETTLLKQLFESLPNLREIQFAGCYDHGKEWRDAKCIQGTLADTIMKETGIELEPWGFYVYGNNRCKMQKPLTSFIQAITCFKNNVQKLDLKDLHVSQFNLLEVPEMTSIRELSLSFLHDTRERYVDVEIARLIAAPTMLDSLELDFDQRRVVTHQPRGPRPMSLNRNDIIRARTDWSTLSNLKLSSISIHQHHLIKFLTSLPNLRTLELADIELETWYLEYNDEEVEDVFAASWIPVFKIMQTSLKLASAVLSGWIAITYSYLDLLVSESVIYKTDGWYLSDRCEPGCQSSASHLKNRVERSIVSGDDFLSTLGDDKSLLKDGGDCSWRHVFYEI